MSRLQFGGWGELPLYFMIIRRYHNLVVWWGVGGSGAEDKRLVYVLSYGIVGSGVWETGAYDSLSCSSPFPSWTRREARQQPPMSQTVGECPVELGPRWARTEVELMWVALDVGVCGASMRSRKVSDRLRFSMFITLIRSHYFITILLHPTITLLVPSSLQRLVDTHHITLIVSTFSDNEPPL